MKKLIKKILIEDRRNMYLDKIIHIMKNEYPIFETLKEYGFYEQLSEDELKYVLSGLFENNFVGNIRLKVDNFNDRFSVEKVNVSDDERNWDTNKLYEETLGVGYYINYYDKNGKLLEYINSDGDYAKFEYDKNGNKIYYERPNRWEKYEYDENGKKTYEEDSRGMWKKREYDEDGNLIYYEHSNGNWGKYEYDENGKQVYFENSLGFIIDKRRKR